MKTTAQLQTDRSSHRSAAESNRPFRETKGSAIIDNRPEAVAQRRLAEVIHNSPSMVAQRRQLRGLFGETAQLKGGPEEEELLQKNVAPVQRQAPEDEKLLQGKFEARQRKGLEEEEPLQGKVERILSAQLKEEAPKQNASTELSTGDTGLLDNLKSGIESLSGLSMDDVNVHYNSSQPARLNALAYTQGTEIHVAPGQEQHLPHEAWHVVQQAQGRVQPTMQLKDGVPVNDDAGLEQEADVMGAKALQMRRSKTRAVKCPIYQVHELTYVVLQNGGAAQRNALIQRRIIIDEEEKWTNAHVNEVWGKYRETEGRKRGDKTIIQDIILATDPKCDPVTWEEFVQLVARGRAPNVSKKRKRKEGEGKSNAAIAWEARKMVLAEKVAAANKSIGEAKRYPSTFYESFLDVPANIRVKIADLKPEMDTHLDREHSRLANFSMSVLEYSKKNLSAAKRSPEIQTAIVETKASKELSLEISGNKAEANKLLASKFGGKSVETVYAETLKPFHVAKKRTILLDAIAKFTPQIMGKFEVEKAPINEYKFDKNQKSFTSPKVLSEEEFTTKAKYAIGYNAHKTTKGGEQNKRRKSARALVKKMPGLSKAEIGIPENEKGIHAESAILKKLKADTERIIKVIGGTKVACTACQTYYTQSGLEALLSDRTSFAWLSESSITQLGYDAEQVTEYLKQIEAGLSERLKDLRFYEGKSGTYGIRDLSDESEMDTDSEDEEAIRSVMETDEIKNRVEDLKGHFSPAHE
ncbi:MAG: hypothetical protein OJF50_003780 [Nitrospira sp.]|jgi:hypothetical protein|nr:hypothetical protein [Nitrospira sp.]